MENAKHIASTPQVISVSLGDSGWSPAQGIHPIFNF